MSVPRPSIFVAVFVCILLVLGSLVQLAAIDLVLPAVPSLPEAVGGDAAAAQLVVAVYVAGTALGLLLFGAAGAVVGRRRLLVGSAVSLGAVSFAAAAADTMAALIAWRFVQGLLAAAPTVYAPGMIRLLFSETGATRAIGAFSSIESLAPAIAPIIGVWLLGLGGWRLSFQVTGAAALVLAALLLLFYRLLPATPPSCVTRSGSYLRLLRSPTYLRYALSQAFVLGGLLIFVFGAPVVIVRTLGGSLNDFIVMQVVGIACFILASNLSGWFVERVGAERMIGIGTGLAALAGGALLLHALLGGRQPWMLVILFAPLNAGLGLRGPPGFLRAIIAGSGDDDRAASLMILAILGTAAAGTALLAPVILHGLPVLCAAVAAVELVAVALLMAVKPLPDSKQA
ncbi:MAG: MFS transporter [Rhodothalassiaceae bacterium]